MAYKITYFATIPNGQNNNNKHGENDKIRINFKRFPTSNQFLVVGFYRRYLLIILLTQNIQGKEHPSCHP